jgi:ketosteroid isomerase-like protein
VGGVVGGEAISGAKTLTLNITAGYFQHSPSLLTVRVERVASSFRSHQYHFMAISRTILESAPWAYFEAVDAKDLERSLSFFADDATFTIQSAGMVFTGREEIAGMFRGFFGDYKTICHNITNIVIDETAAKSATEQTCPHIKLDGSPDTLTTCNFFTFAADGKFQRVIIWIDGVSPLVGE